MEGKKKVIAEKLRMRKCKMAQSIKKYLSSTRTHIRCTYMDCSVENREAVQTKYQVFIYTSTINSVVHLVFYDILETGT